MPQLRLSAPDRKARNAPLRLAAWYVAASVLWIAVSDRLLASLGLPHALETQLNSLKGFGFVLVTGTILFVAARRTLQRLEASETRYFRLFENATEGVVLYRVVRDDDGRVSDLVVEDVNPAQIERASRPREAIVGVRMSDADDVDEELKAYFGVVRAAVSESRAVRAEVHIADRDAYTLVAAFPYERGLWALAATDITQVRHAQQVMRQQDERIRQAYEDVLDAVTGGKLVLMPEGALMSALGEPLTGEQEICVAEDLGPARQRIRAAVASRFGGIDVDALLNASGEALNNVLKHAGGGSWSVYAREGVAQVAVSDHGPGIDFRTLPKATLVPGFSTTATLGMGFTIILQLCDRVLLATRPGLTVIVLEVGRPKDAPRR